MNGSECATGPASVSTCRNDEYWTGRQDLAYYKTVLQYARKYCPNGKTLLDIGGGVGLGCRYLERFDGWGRTSVELPTRGCSLPGVRTIYAGFSHWPIDRRYDLVLCLQCLEHVDDAASFAKKLFHCGPVVVISVPYRWPAPACSEHIHDPVDEQKLNSWTGIDPIATTIIDSRLVAVYT